MGASKPVVGIGACLVGQPVRYNGESKRKNHYIEALKHHLAMQPFCPEMAIGLGVPRPTVRLVGEAGAARLMDSDTQSQDYTEPMREYAHATAARHPELSGYILVKGSPSCGFERVKRYHQKGRMIASDSAGLFASELMKHDPLLPMEEDGRLHDHTLRENFVGRVYAYHEWKQFCVSGVTLGRLMKFWSRYKYLVMAHHVGSYQSIGRMLAKASPRDIDNVAAEFIALLMQALSHRATRKSHSNTLEHIRGYLKNALSASDKKELGDLIEQYRTGLVPLVVPLTLLRHHFRNHANPYIDQQVFLMPYPEQLSLRNHI